MTCLVVGFKIEINTKSLSLVNLNETRTERLEWLFSLRENSLIDTTSSERLKSRAFSLPPSAFISLILSYFSFFLRSISSSNLLDTILEKSRVLLNLTPGDISS